MPAPQLAAHDPVPLGLYQLTATVDPPALALEPVRITQAPGDGALYAADVTSFFRSDCADCFRVEGLTSNGGMLEATVRLRHPFPLPAQAGEFGPGERLDLHVFDAMLLVHNRTDAGYTVHFPLSGERAEPGFLTWGLDHDAPDGYTGLLEPWFEQAGFTNEGTLDPYIIFSRSAASQPEGNAAPHAANGFDDLRTVSGYNSLRQGEERTLRVQLHLGNRASVNLQVAILASYMNKAGANPNPDLPREALRQRPVYQLPAANLLAPWRVQGSAPPLDLTAAVRATSLSLQVWDWQHNAFVNPLWTPDHVPTDTIPFTSRLAFCQIEVPGWFDELQTATVFTGTGRGNTPLIRTQNLSPTLVPPTGTSYALITAVDQRDEFGTTVLDRQDVQSLGKVRTSQVVPIEVVQTALSIDPATLTVEAVVGIPLGHQFGISGGVQPWQVTAPGGLPAWASLSNTGALSGTPLAPLGTTQRTLRVRDSANPPAELTVPWTLHVRTGAGDVCDEPDPVITTAPLLPEGRRAQPYSVQINASAGVPPYSFSIQPGSSLPAGLSLTPAGLLHGTPADGASGQTHFFTLRVTDSCAVPQHGTKAFELTIPCDTLAILTTDIAPIAAGTVPPPITATGELPASFTITNGAAGLAAAGLSLNADGSFGGAALESARGTLIPFTVRASDLCATSTPVTRDFVLRILCDQPPVITKSAPPPITYGQPYQHQFTATGGQGSLSWSLLTPQTTPTNTTLTPQGLLTIDPLATEGGKTFRFTIRIEDNCPLVQLDDWEVELAFPCPATPVISTRTLPLPEISVPYLFEFLSSEGTGELTWYVSGQVPPGLSFDKANAQLAGTVGAGASGNSYSFTISVGDECGAAFPPDDSVNVQWVFP